ncbi:putative Haloacid dehalogenase [Seiridium cardinale]
MARPNLLLCFDAFGTLFKPKRSIAQQYSEVAATCGLTGIKVDDVQTAFRAAFKDESKSNPNYGKVTGLGATKWWENVIHKTFEPLVGHGKALPADLAPRLLQRFASIQGYDLEPTLASSLKALRLLDPGPKSLYHRIVVGVVTNSDDRVPGILSSSGLKISPLRYGTHNQKDVPNDKNEYDVDFHCMSYDVGVEKPDKLMFSAAELLLARILATRDGKSRDEAQAEGQIWRKIYVGDEYAKDVVGASNAGWNPVLLDAEDQVPDIPKLQNSAAKSLDGFFGKHPVAKVCTIKELVTWLTGRYQED